MTPNGPYAQFRRMRAIWAYDLEHLAHPFIQLGLETLMAAGWEVTVVAADKAEPGAPYRSRDGFSYQRREQAHRRLIVDARKRIDGTIEQLGGSGLRVAVLRLWSELVRCYALARHFTWEKWRIYLRGLLALAGEKGDVMIASRPQAAVWACLVAKAKGMRFVYYPFELYGEQIIPPWPPLVALERLMLRHFVDAVVTQNACRAAVLRDERGARVEPMIVHNYKRQPTTRRTGAGGKLRAALGLDRKTRIVLYEGYIVHSRWLEFLAQATRHLPDDVVVVMMGEEKLKWRREYRKHLKAPVAEGRLIFAPPVRQAELLDYVADADVGVIIYDDKVRNNVFCEPGKLSDYIAAGVPVAAPNFPTLGPVVREYGLGLCFDGHKPQDIAAVLMKALETPKSAWRAGIERARRELTWESQAPNLLAAVSGELAPARATVQAHQTDLMHQT